MPRKLGQRPAGKAALPKRRLRRTEEDAITHRTARRRRAQAIIDLQVWLATTYPGAFSNPPVPLAIGIDTALKQALAGLWSGKVLKPVLILWCSRKAYVAAVAAGEPRRNLDGSLAGVPTERHREIARAFLATCTQAKILRRYRTRHGPGVLTPEQCRSRPKLPHSARKVIMNDTPIRIQTKAPKVTLPIDASLFPFAVVPSPGTPGSKTMSMAFDFDYGGGTLTAALRVAALQKLAASAAASPQGGLIILQGRLGADGKLEEAGATFQLRQAKPGAET